MSNNNDIPTNKKAINSYINNWRGNNPSIIQIKQKEEEFNQLKLQYEDAYKTYIQNVERGSKKNYTLSTGQNVHGVEELIEKNKVRYIRVEHNFQYIHIIVIYYNLTKGSTKPMVLMTAATVDGII